MMVCEDKAGSAVVAAKCGNNIAMKFLLNNGVDVDTTDGNGMTLLHHAVSGDWQHVVQILLKHGAKLDAKTSSGQTALHLLAML